MKKLLILISFIIISTISQARVSYYKAYFFIKTVEKNEVVRKDINFRIKMDNEKNQIVIYSNPIKSLRFSPLQDKFVDSGVCLFSTGFDGIEKIDIIIYIKNDHQILLNIYYSSHIDRYLMYLSSN